MNRKSSNILHILYGIYTSILFLIQNGTPWVTTFWLIARGIALVAALTLFIINIIQTRKNEDFSGFYYYLLLGFNIISILVMSMLPVFTFIFIPLGIYKLIKKK